MREVDKATYYAAIGPLNVNGRIVTDKYPYTTEHCTPAGWVRGRVVGFIPEGTAMAAYRYYLPVGNGG